MPHKVLITEISFTKHIRRKLTNEWRFQAKTLTEKISLEKLLVNLWILTVSIFRKIHLKASSSFKLRIIAEKEMKQMSEGKQTRNDKTHHSVWFPWKCEVYKCVEVKKNDSTINTTNINQNETQLRHCGKKEVSVVGRGSYNL